MLIFVVFYINKDSSSVYRYRKGRKWSMKTGECKKYLTEDTTDHWLKGAIYYLTHCNFNMHPLQCWNETVIVMTTIKLTAPSNRYCSFCVDQRWCQQDSDLLFFSSSFKQFIIILFPNLNADRLFQLLSLFLIFKTNTPRARLNRRRRTSGNVLSATRSNVVSEKWS